MSAMAKIMKTPRDHLEQSTPNRVYFVTKVRLVKAMVFSVVMYGCESWTVKKAECRRIDAFELLLKNSLESPLDCKEIQPVHSNGWGHRPNAPDSPVRS